MNGKKGGEKSGACTITLELLAQLQSCADDPGKLAERLAEAVRLITNALCVLVVQDLDSGNGREHRVIGMNTAGDCRWSESEEAYRLYDIVCKLPPAQYWHLAEFPEADELLKKAGFGLCLGFPLQAGKSCAGSLLVLGVPDDTIPDALQTELATLAFMAAQGLCSTSYSGRQEQTVRELTAALQTAREEVRAGEIRNKTLYEESKQTQHVLLSLLEDEKRAEDALQESEVIFSSFLEHSPVYVFFKDKNIRSLRLSRNFEKMLGMPVEKALGKTMDELFPSDLANSMVEDDLKILNGGQLVNVVEELNGHIYETTKFPIFKDGIPYMLAGFTLDITERRKAEEELEKYRLHLEELIQERTNELSTANINLTREIRERQQIEEELRQAEKQLKEHVRNLEKSRKEAIALMQEANLQKEKAEKTLAELIIAKEQADVANQSKSMFLANMSHEIRTPLNAILGYSQLLARDPFLQGNQRKKINTIIQSGEHLLKLINSILEISKIEAGRVMLQLELCNFKILLDGIKSMFQLKARNRHIDFAVEITGNMLYPLIIDKNKLIQVLINLVGNAFKFTDSGNIRLKAVIDPGEQGNYYITFIVNDTGSGIDRNDLERIFEAFEQAESGKKMKGGAGLGLAICREYVRLMGGDLKVESRVNQGSSFYFTIPVKAARSAARERARETKQGARKKLKKPRDAATILIVEDDIANRNFISTTLREEGFNVLEAENGSAGIEMFRNSAPALILMDNRMPVMNGIDALRKIKAEEKGRKTPVVMFTASVFMRDRNLFLKAGADDVLIKPVILKDLFSSIRKFLNIEENAFLSEYYPDIDPSIQSGNRRIRELPEAIKIQFIEAAQKLEYDTLKSLAADVFADDPLISGFIQEIIDDYNFEEITRLFS